MALTVEQSFDANKQLGIVPFEGPRAEAHELEYDVVDGITYVHFTAGGKQYSLASRAPRSVLVKQATYAMHGIKRHMEKMSDPERARFNHTIRNSVVTVTPNIRRTYKRDAKGGMVVEEPHITISEKSVMYGIPGTRHFESLHRGELIGLTDKTQKNLNEYASTFRLVPRGFRPLRERVPIPGGEEVIFPARLEGEEEVTLSVGVEPKGLGQKAKEVTMAVVTAAADMLTRLTPDSMHQGM